MNERTYNAKTPQQDMINPVSKKRYWELDFLRGFCVILMVIDHFFFSAMDFLPSIWSFFNNEFWKGLQRLATIYWYNNAHTVAHYVVITLFFLICGVSCTLSRNNALRGVKTLAAGLVITIATYLADSFFNLNALIIFGVIHMLGCSILLFSLVDLAGWGIQKLIWKCFKGDKAVKRAVWVRKLLPMAIGIIGLIVFFALPMAHFVRDSRLSLDIDGEKVVFSPYTMLISDISADGSNSFLTFLSFFVELKNFYPNSADYFPIIPYAFIVLIGSGIGHLAYGTKAKNFLRPLDGKWNKPVGFVGRRALIVYLLHQIVIVAFLYAAGGLYSIGK